MLPLQGAGVEVDSSSSDDGIYVCRIVNCQVITDPMCCLFVTITITIMTRQSRLESVHSILVLQTHRLVSYNKMDCLRHWATLPESINLHEVCRIKLLTLIIGPSTPDRQSRLDFETLSATFSSLLAMPLAIGQQLLQRYDELDGSCEMQFTFGIKWLDISLCDAIIKHLDPSLTEAQVGIHSTRVANLSALIPIAFKDA